MGPSYLAGFRVSLTLSQPTLGFSSDQAGLTISCPLTKEEGDLFIRPSIRPFSKCMLVKSSVNRRLREEGRRLSQCPKTWILEPAVDLFS